MKLKVILLSICSLAMLFLLIKQSNKQPIEVDLPEEYMCIDKDTPIQGYMKDGKLFIEFKHDYENID